MADADTLVGGPGRDLLLSGGGWGAALYGRRGPEVLRATDRGDILNPGLGRDRLYAGDGRDLIPIQDDGVKDRVMCGPGRDRVNYFATGIDPLDSYRGCERVLSTASLTSGPQGKDRSRCLGRATTIVGTSAAETVVGTPGPDVIAAGGGDDTVIGRGGDDRICGDNGIDVLLGSPGDDRIGEGAEHSGPFWRDFFVGGPGDDVLRGVVAVYEGGPRPIRVDGRDGTVTGRGHDQLVQVMGVLGTAYGDRFIGGPHSDRFFGEVGNDVISGGAGKDRLHGGRGADALGASHCGTEPAQA